MDPGSDAAYEAVLRADGGSPEWRRLRWRACRRGMKELDVLFERYLDHDWETASADERRTFLRLLELPDPDLAALCLQRAPTADAAFAALIGKLTDGRHARLRS